MVNLGYYLVTLLGGPIPAFKCDVSNSTRSGWPPYLRGFASVPGFESQACFLQFIFKKLKL